MRWRSAVGGSWARAGAAVALAKGAARLFAVFDLLIKELIEVGVSEPERETQRKREEERERERKREREKLREIGRTIEKYRERERKRDI